MDINELLFAIVAFDALVVIGMGVLSAVLILLKIENDFFWGRVWPATLALILSSLASGALIWVGDYMFGG